MRTVSKKRAKLKRETDPQRRAFVETVKTCMVCDGAPAVDCHEIARGAAREAALQLPQLWLAVCRKCHDNLDDVQAFPSAKQLSYRIMHDIRRAVFTLNEARGRAQTDVTVNDVIGRLTFRNHPKK